MIDSLTVESLRSFLISQLRSVSEEQSHTLQLAYQYYLEKDDLSTVVREIKRGFSPARILNANDSDSGSKGLLETGQLIGRGARYNPFSLNQKISYQRRFDESDETASLLLETLHYHTLNEPQYIKNLMASLDKMNLATGTDEKNQLKSD